MGLSGLLGWRLGWLGLVLGFLGAQLTGVFAPHVETLPAGVHHAELSLWHGVGLPLLFFAAASTRVRASTVRASSTPRAGSTW